MTGNTYPATEHFTGEGTWNREARRVLHLTAERGIQLDAESLLLRDIRDLRAMSARLQQGRDRQGQRRIPALFTPLHRLQSSHAGGSEPAP
jgi:hypothetical protein